MLIILFTFIAIYIIINRLKKCTEHPVKFTSHKSVLIPIKEVDESNISE